MKSISIQLIAFAACVASSISVSSSASTATTNRLLISAMDKLLPEFSLPWEKFEVPSLAGFSRIAARSTRKRIYGYAKIYSSLLMKHLSSETEVLIQQGVFDVKSRQVLNNLEFEMGILQYRSHLQNILKDWSDIIGGQPLLQAAKENIIVRMDDIVNEFEEYIYKLQAIAIKNRHFKDNLICQSVCKSRYGILNLTSLCIPAELEEYLKNGSNFVPNSVLATNELKALLEKDLVNAAIGYFRDKYQIYPLVSPADGLRTVLQQLISQAQSNSRHVTFFTAMHDYYYGNKKEFFDKLSKRHFIKHPCIQKFVPSGTILAEADKGLGPVLLPVSWFIDQYQVQALKGDHVKTGLSNAQCINLLKREIDTFRAGLSEEGRVVLKKYFRNTNPNFRVGVLKLVPKVHKLSVFDKDSWKSLPSRPIRGAENCPINPYSQALCRMLQEMHSELNLVFAKRGLTFPAIYGCDEYSGNLKKVNIQHEKSSTLTLISGDFSDAYTQSRLADLQASLEQIGRVVGWTVGKVLLAQQLSKLVFDNCYFETPSGIMRQTRGFPMGGHSSREGLDNILLAAEFIFLAEIDNNALEYYYRMVDDISLAVVGSFLSVRHVLGVMARSYPLAMPLNIQISFGYSHFLDVHINNFLQPLPSYKLTTSLAYKPLSRFDYLPYNSNIAPKYKGCVVPSFLHRVFSRCTRDQDIQHHVRFLRRILNHRNQNMKCIAARFTAFFAKMHGSKIRSSERTRFEWSKELVCVKFDSVSLIHLFTRRCILSSYKASGSAKPRFILSNLPRVMTRITTKRKVLSMLKKQSNY